MLFVDLPQDESLAQKTALVVSDENMRFRVQYFLGLHQIDNKNNNRIDFAGMSFNFMYRTKKSERSDFLVGISDTKFATIRNQNGLSTLDFEFKLKPRNRFSESKDSYYHHALGLGMTMNGLKQTPVFRYSIGMTVQNGNSLEYKINYYAVQKYIMAGLALSFPARGIFK